MNKVYIVYTTFRTHCREDNAAWHVREEVDDIFSSEEKAIKYIRESISELVANPNIFTDLNYSVCISSYIKNGNISNIILKDGTNIICGRNDTGETIGIMYRSHIVK